MNDPTDLPLALYQANFDLQVRIGELLQDSGRHWLEFGQRLVNDGLVENGAELQQLMAAGDWQKLAALPADAFWRQLQQRFGDQQAAAQIAVAAQSSFARDLQDALSRWQQETIAAMDEAGFGLAVPAVDTRWTAMFGNAASPRAPAAKKAAPAAPAANRPARKPTASKATAKKATAKKASAEKATAKKAAAGKPAAKKARASTAAKAKNAPAKAAKKTRSGNRR